MYKFSAERLQAGHPNQGVCNLGKRGRSKIFPILKYRPVVLKFDQNFEPL